MAKETPERAYTFEELIKLSGSQLDYIENVKRGQLELVENKRLKQIGRIMWIENQINAVAE